MCVFNVDPGFALAGIDCALSGGLLLWIVEKSQTKPTTFSGTAFFTQEELWIKREILPDRKSLF